MGWLLVLCLGGSYDELVAVESWDPRFDIEFLDPDMVFCNFFLADCMLVLIGDVRPLNHSIPSNSVSDLSGWLIAVCWFA